jgi:diketogulonate reductase-like aldo/keto reductase
MSLYSVVGCILGAVLVSSDTVGDGLYVSRTLPSVPRIGLGTAGMGGWTELSICDALESGFRLIDTAQAHEWYSEQALGEALEHCWWGRELDDLTIVTKVHPRSYEPAKLLASLEASSRAIYGKTPAGPSRPLDAVLLHAPFCWQNHCSPQDLAFQWQDAWPALEHAQALGKVQAIGVSNMGVYHMTELLGFANTKPALLQNWMDPFNQDRAVRSLCEEHGIAYMAYSTFGTQWNHKFKENPVFTSDVLLSIADRHNVNVTDVVLSWAVQEGVIVLPRSSSKAHIASNAALLPSVGETVYNTFLSADDMKAIAALDGTLGSLWE